MNIIYTIISFLFGIMIGWVCFKLIRKIEMVTYQFVVFIFSVLSGGAVLKLGDADIDKIMFHLFGIFIGWLLWLYLARKLGAKPDVFYSKAKKEGDEEAIIRQRERYEMFY